MRLKFKTCFVCVALVFEFKERYGIVPTTDGWVSRTLSCEIAERLLDGFSERPGCLVLCLSMGEHSKSSSFGTKSISSSEFWCETGSEIMISVFPRITFRALTLAGLSAGVVKGKSLLFRFRGKSELASPAFNVEVGLDDNDSDAVNRKFLC